MLDSEVGGIANKQISKMILPAINHRKLRVSEEEMNSSQGSLKLAKRNLCANHKKAFVG